MKRRIWDLFMSGPTKERRVNEKGEKKTRTGSESRRLTGYCKLTAYEVIVKTKCYEW